jgi:hypothetical protein
LFSVDDAPGGVCCERPMAGLAKMVGIVSPTRKDVTLSFVAVMICHPKSERE